MLQEFYFKFTMNFVQLENFDLETITSTQKSSFYEKRHTVVKTATRNTL